MTGNRLSIRHWRIEHVGRKMLSLGKNEVCFLEGSMDSDVRQA